MLGENARPWRKHHSSFLTFDWSGLKNFTCLLDMMGASCCKTSKNSDFLLCEWLKLTYLQSCRPSENFKNLLLCIVPLELSEVTLIRSRFRSLTTRPMSWCIKNQHCHLTAKNPPQPRWHVVERDTGFFPEFCVERRLTMSELSLLPFYMWC